MNGGEQLEISPARLSPLSLAGFFLRQGRLIAWCCAVATLAALLFALLRPRYYEATAAFTLELQAAVNGVKQGREPDLLSGQLARHALVLCHKEIQSVRSGKPVTVS